MALLILALLQRIFLMSSLMLLLVWLIFFMVLIKLLDRKSGSAGMPRPISYAVFCLKKKRSCSFLVRLSSIPEQKSPADFEDPGRVCTNPPSPDEYQTFSPDR